ncbi:hypothetical protein F441_02801, partial [Phytophthora nicotianae CJ01A1]
PTKKKKTSAASTSGSSGDGSDLSDLLPSSSDSGSEPESSATSDAASASEGDNYLAGLFSATGSDLLSSSLSEALKSAGSQTKLATRAPSTPSPEDDSGADVPAETPEPEAPASTPAPAPAPETAASGNGSSECSTGWWSGVKSWFKNTFGDGDKCKSSRRLRLE